MARKTAAQLNREIAVALARPRHRTSHLDQPGTRDVTDEVLRDSSYGPGDAVRRVATAKPAKNVEVTPTLAATLARIEASSDPTMGFISKALAYSRAVGRGAQHSNLIRLIKGGYVRVCEVSAPSPQGSVAYQDSPYGAKHYVLRIGHCG